MSTVTPEIILSWPAPNYVDPVTLTRPIHAVNAIAIVLMTIFFVARFYARLGIVQKALGVDDWIILAAYATLVSQATISSATALIKISIWFSYLHLFPKNLSGWFNYSMIGILAAYAFSTAFAAGFQCLSISDAWTVFKPLSEKRCTNQQAFVIFLSVANGTFDILVFLWPAPVLWSIKLPRHTRITLLISFCRGVFVCILGLVRVRLTIFYFHHWDATWNVSVIFMFFSAELALGFICASFPGIRPLWPRLRSKKDSSTSPSTNNNGYGYIVDEISAGKNSNASKNSSVGENSSAVENSNAKKKYLNGYESELATADIELELQTERAAPATPSSLDIHDLEFNRFDPFGNGSQDRIVTGHSPIADA